MIKIDFFMSLLCVKFALNEVQRASGQFLYPVFSGVEVARQLPISADGQGAARVWRLTVIMAQHSIVRAYGFFGTYYISKDVEIIVQITRRTG